MSWINTSDRKPTGDELTSSYPFVSNDAEKSWSDPHMGNYVDPKHGWWCDSCQSWVADSVVVAWFDLPPYEGG